MTARERLAAVIEGVPPLHDAVERLPVTGGAAPAHALVRSAVAPMLANPNITEPQVSQAVLGAHLLVLRRRGRWLHCRSDDGYLGWVHRGYLLQVDEAAARTWEIGTEGEACLALGAEVHDNEGHLLARLPWGSRFVCQPDGTARLPDGQSGRVIGETLPVAERASRFPTDGAAAVRTAARWLGSPYQWAGVTPSGVDCSGLVQAVWRLHGLLIPRDSDLQAVTGEPVHTGNSFQNCEPGDLLFFAEEPGRITHVTMSTGGPRIIHASLGNGGVRRNDLTGDTGFERDLRDIFVCARRVGPAGAA